MISFSKQVKEELLIIKEENIKTILSSIILAIGSVQFWEDDVILEVKSSNISLIRKFVKLIKTLDYDLEEQIIIRENKKFKKHNRLYIVSIESQAKKFLTDLGLIQGDVLGIFINLNIPDYIKEDELNLEEFLRYLFVCSGSINNPKVQKQYHLEIICNNNNILDFTKEKVSKYDINFKVTTRKSVSALYLNKGEEIADFLRLIGCIKTMFDFEDQRLMRDIRAFENRLINAEVANEAKKNIASLKQIEAIKKLKKENRYALLKDKTKLIAKARIENKEASLNELTEILEGRISKTNIRYHLKLLVEEADKI